MKKTSSDLCPICQLVAGELDQLITTNSTQVRRASNIVKIMFLYYSSNSAGNENTGNFFFQYFRIIYYLENPLIVRYCLWCS